MRELGEEPRLSTGSAVAGSGGLLKTGVISLLLHIAFVIFLGLNLKAAVHQTGQPVYRVSIRPFSPPGNGLPEGGRGPGGPSSAPVTTEKARPEEATRKGRDLAEREREKTPKKGKKIEREVVQPVKKSGNETLVGLKKPQKKLEKTETQKVSGESLQEAIADIRKRAALDEIQKRVAQRAHFEKRSSGEGGQGSIASQGPDVSSLKPSGSGSGMGTGSGSGSGTGFGSGSGSGTGTGTGPGGGTALDVYSSVVWEKIKSVWTLPENLPKGKTELEAIIVILIEREGRIQKATFEKRSGNTLFDQMAMRAIRKADPLPPFPQELGESTLEIGIRFYPD